MDENRAQVPLWLIAVIVVAISLSVAAVIVIKRPEKKPSFDFGDAPDPTYPSLLASNGARHADITRAWFRDNVDAETDARVTDLDDFDDGLISPDPITFKVTNNNWPDNLFVNILIDYNNDGDWADDNEWAVQNFRVSVPQGQSQEFDTEVSLPLDTWMRMTLTDVPLTNYVGTGEFKIGETEDIVKRVPHEPPPCWFNIELEPEEQLVGHGAEVGIRIVLKAGHPPDNLEIRRVTAGVLYPPFLGLPEPAEVELVPPDPDIEVPEPIGIPAPNPVQIPNLRIDPPDPGDPADTLGWVRFDTVLDLPERIEVIEITVEGRSAARVDLETAEVQVYHHRPVHFLELSVDSPKTAGQSSPITVRAYDAENNPVSGARISLVALPMRGKYAGDYEVNLALTDRGDGTYTSNLTSTLARVYSLHASVEGTDITASDNVIFVAGPVAEVKVSSAVGPRADNMLISFYGTDDYGNVAHDVEPLVVTSFGHLGEVRANPNNTFDVNLSSTDWGVAEVTVTDNKSKVSGSLEVEFLPLHLETERWPVWPAENELSVRVSVFVPPARGELNKYEMTIQYDNSIFYLLSVSDADPTDGFIAPTVEVLSGNSFKVSQEGYPPESFFDVFVLNFEALAPGSGVLSITDVHLADVTMQPVYDEKGMIVGYEKITHPLLVPVAVENVKVVYKTAPLVEVLEKYWIVENSGVTEDKIRADIKKKQEMADKATRECDLDCWYKFVAEFNVIPKGGWDNIAGPDNRLTRAERDNLAGSFKVENRVNIYYVPTCTLPRGVLGQWVRGVGIFIDDGKDFDNLTLAHEVVHELSGSGVKDNEAGAAQGATRPGNIMNYDDTGDDLTPQQGALINDHVRKNVKQGRYTP